jgi:crotonobetainyl-CoA:carnitine CoA-transferase CaiB-like acyl-CoA transferase
MERWGLDYPALAAVKPDLVMLSTCLMGQTGPLARFAGYGNLAAAISGFSNLGGWPDRAPAGPFSAYTDYVSPRFIAVAILAALDHRRRTGEGQYVDLAQAEASLHFLAPAILDYEVNGRIAGRVGNRDPEHAPHGIYPVTGDDRWVAIAVTTDAEWQALCAIMRRSDLADDPRLADAGGRRAHADLLDDAVAAWTVSRDGFAIEAALQARAVPAHVVQTSHDLMRDPQLAHRRHFVTVAHPMGGTTVVEGSRFVLSRTPAEIADAAPSYGRDNETILREILGYDDDAITALVEAGALE